MGQYQNPIHYFRISLNSAFNFCNTLSIPYLISKSFQQSSFKKSKISCTYKELYRKQCNKFSNHMTSLLLYAFLSAEKNFSQKFRKILLNKYNNESVSWPVYIFQPMQHIFVLFVIIDVTHIISTKLFGRFMSNENNFSSSISQNFNSNSRKTLLLFIYLLND